MASSSNTGASLSIEDMYQKMSQREHILARPDTYVGDIKVQKERMFVATNDEDGNITIAEQEIEYVPGLYKIFDEVLVNALDHYVRLLSKGSTNPVKNIKITINEETGSITVWNDGEGIDVAMHQQYEVYVPSLIFGEFMTSTNFDDDEKRITGGRNGFGAKLTNVFSTYFCVETVDATRGLKFKQEWFDNMTRKSDAIITKCKTAAFTSVTFTPDYARFGLPKQTPHMVSLFTKRVYDAAMLTDKVNVFLNGTKVLITNFKKYIDLYGFNADSMAYEDVNDRWEVAAVYVPDCSFKDISFVNGICTYRGGTHVNYVIDNVVKRLIESIKKKHKDINIKPSNIKEHLVLFVKCTIENPTFTSQTKETLSSKVSSFGSACEVSDKFIAKLSKSGLSEIVVKLVQVKDNVALKKSDGKKTSKISGIPKLEDATWAGTKKSSECKLILTEGDSAKALAMAARAEIGSERFGVFPLRGKLLNVREASPKQLAENEEIVNLKKILGLHQGKDYDPNTAAQELRYGGIVILTDADVDGSHIKGLIINFFHYFWPSLIKLGYITTLSTPIIKATKGQNIVSFYNQRDYEAWKASTPNAHQWNIKYYKGLGTSNKEEGIEYFTDIENKLIHYMWGGEDTTDAAVVLAFDKKHADDRKAWLLSYDRNAVLDNTQKQVEVADFVHKDLIHFSNDDIQRSIPSMVDGLKTSQRKILYGTIQRKLNGPSDEIRVAQLAGYVSDKTRYHHGEQSLNKAIISMTQSYVGSNNINLLHPSGMCGTRLAGGQDAASPRYVNTYLAALTRLLYRPEDDPILTYLDDDGVMVEPEWYVPIIPMVLVNGARGIGTGFSTNIPSFNPIDIAANVVRMLENKKVEPMVPWFRDFTGEVSVNNEAAPTEYVTKGRIQAGKRDGRVDIVELPIGTWTYNYKEFLEKQLDAKDSIIEDYVSASTDVAVHFSVTLKDPLLSDDVIMSKLNLISKDSMKNMHLYNCKGCIRKYDTLEDIFNEFYDVRLRMYTKRKEYMIAKLEEELKYLANKKRFIEMVLDKKIVLEKRSKANIVEQLYTHRFDKINDGYDYLTDMPLMSLSLEKIEDIADKVVKKEAELRGIIATTELQMWKREIDEFVEAYITWSTPTTVAKATKAKAPRKKLVL